MALFAQTAPGGSGAAPATAAAPTGAQAAPPAPAGSQTQIGQKQVTNLPLEQRDSTHLLLLSAGTTGTGTGINQTQQFSIHGQSGSASVFAMDGVDTSEPEMGGATIADFNVDAIQQMQTLSGVMPASIGNGAAGYTNIITKHGTRRFHGDAFEFLRNSSLDARNFFDRRSYASPGRIPPFRRNEFGFTLGGPLLPGAANPDRTTFFIEYQGLRQMQSATENLAVPTAGERQGIDTTAFPGDTLYVPVNPAMQPVLDLYPLPNDPTGPFGARTFATATNVSTLSDQASVRVDHTFSPSTRFMGRYTGENVAGPLTNPDQTAINPSWARTFTAQYRSVALRLLHDFSPDLSSETTFGFLRSTPVYSSENYSQPGLTFADNLYEPVNSQAGGTSGVRANTFEFRQTMAYLHGKHNFMFGTDIELRRATGQFASNVDGSYGFGGGPVDSPVAIVSASGQHDIQPGEVLPDTLSSLLTATPYSFNRSVGGQGFPQGLHTGETTLLNEIYDFFFLDDWHVTPRLSIDYGVRYELDTPLREEHHETSSPVFLGPDGQQVPWSTPGATEQWLVDPQPVWHMQKGQFAPRLALSYGLGRRWLLHAASGVTTQLAVPWGDMSITSGFPFIVPISATARPGAALPFQDSVIQFEAPPAYTPSGQLVYPGGSKATPANTAVDLTRYEQDLAAVLPGHQMQPIQVFGQDNDFRQGYLFTYSTGVEYSSRTLSLGATYIGIAGNKLMGTFYPNAYAGASPGFAPFSQFNTSGQFAGGFGYEGIYSNPYHSTYNGLELVARVTPSRWGTAASVSYTFSKSIDNIGGGNGGSPPDPLDLNLEKAVSNSDVPQILTFSLSQPLPFDRWASAGWLRAALREWSVEGIGEFDSGSPFTVTSGVIQTGFGQSKGDRPDQVGTPSLSTSRTVREDYFGEGAANNSFFSIPIHVPGGTGPNQGELGTLGRNTFFGPGVHNVDLALIKTMHWRANDRDDIVEFRAEFYNFMNLVNFANPNAVVSGSGFGVINQTSPTAGNSRQLQFSLKLSF